MNLLELTNNLTQLHNKCRMLNIKPENVKVVIYHTNDEVTGNIFDLKLFKEISSDEIPYDMHDQDIIQEFDNVLIISGE